MNTIYNKFLIVLAIILALGGVYMYLSHDLEVQAEAADSSITSSSTNTSPMNALGDSADAQIFQDTSFLSTLTSLTKIKIDTSLFSSVPFNALNDNTVILEPSIPGRPNPFAPIDNVGSPSDVQVSPVVTNPPAQITTKTAVLNGAIDDTSTLASTYFEYGPTPTLGKSTTPVKQSLIGTFVTSISGLTSGTTYFFRAVAKIGGTTHFGEIVSFTTN